MGVSILKSVIMQPIQIIKAGIITTLGVGVVGLIYLIAGAMSAQVIFALVLGLLAAVLADVLLFLAAKYSKNWQLFYIARVFILLIAVIVSVVFSEIFNPTVTVISLIISLPALAVSGLGGRKNV